MKNINIILLLGLISTGAYSQNDSTAFYYQKGTAEKEARRFREAEKDFAIAARFSPTDAKVLTGWGQSLVEQKRYLEAKEKYAAAYQVDNKNAEVIENLATSSMNARQWNEAITYA